MGDPPPPYNTKYEQRGGPPQPPPQYQVTQGMGERQPIMYQQPSYMQPQPSTVIIQAQPPVILVGGCPACRVGVLQDDFTCLGVFCAIFFFPLGVLCCLAMRERRCPNCGAVFG
ncbi:hypothetical protein NP493_829g00042 [Ridgeia piscesae]|uniref:Membrane protein BRI3 n=1 Tax=Ridgeia piscesae TaxID=27915 RepID=A0AAD9NKX0_RIDPI|nr:hypothetical protein NP493_829g00042 [Ridgeia piscesae]